MHNDNNYSTNESKMGIPATSPLEKIRITEQQLHNTLNAVAVLPQHLACIDEYVNTAMALQTAFGVKWIRQAMQRSRHVRDKAKRDPIVMAIIEGNPPKLNFSSFAHAAKVIRQPFAVEFQPFVAEPGVHPLRVSETEECDIREHLVDGLSCLESRFQSEGFMVRSCFWPQCDLSNSLLFDRQVFRISAILGHRCVLVLSDCISA